MQLCASLSVCPIHFQRLFQISSSAGIWFVLSHSRLLLIVSGERTRNILCRQLLINTCIFWMMAFVVLQVSAPYRRTVLTFVLKIPTLMLAVDSCFELQMFFSYRDAALALPTRPFTSASDPSCSSVILPKYVKVFTSSKSPSSKNWLVHVLLYRRIMLFPLCVLRPTAAEAAATLVVFSCICCYVCDKKSPIICEV
ncbi:hypothetical protein MS3_00004045 [Schistosoma haematobium]|uniref:Uncharacterized protein n=1 Tax=Schistosoma haematobium TaxID=6185 RepID=A0A922S519_SCHHA|nr:hypothetical protein MS3_00004045 [Schistosoma haematobium]KAH9594125.1 hypothetical protein MS3_00004045 [Schistosoma haematobium]